MPAEGTLPEPNFQLLTRAMSGSQAGRRGHAVQRRGAVPGGGAAHDRIAGSAADARQAQCGACDSARSRSAGHAMSWTIACPRQCNCGWSRCRKSALRKGRSRCPRLRRAGYWRLLTTHSIATAAEAWRIVDWYQARWTIEQLFRVMKSQDLQLEDSQLGPAERLVKLTAVATKSLSLRRPGAACVDIQLTQERYGKHQMPAANVFTEPEIETLAALGPTLEGKTERQQNHHPARGLAWAAWTIARLGGWNCYYKPPGPITFRRGMEQFHAIHRGRQLDMSLQRQVRIP